MTKTHLYAVSHHLCFTLKPKFHSNPPLHLHNSLSHHLKTPQQQQQTVSKEFQVSELLLEFRFLSTVHLRSGDF
ncbi:hypothetical protein L2E82_45537 [Cichorium intybus]|uniref:Uncharacterized protein n=1 Tax=Cichorium intybus TaxID=13427 RepID=A0ACB8ZT56_CICIN|nr:hypothetical protein L2E82_45537 [Cichorium intybus]